MLVKIERNNKKWVLAKSRKIITERKQKKNEKTKNIETR